MVWPLNWTSLQTIGNYLKKKTKKKLGFTLTIRMKFAVAYVFLTVLFVTVRVTVVLFSH